MLSENLQIYHDTFDLCKALYQYMDKVPRSLRYGEYGHTLSMSLDALDMVYVANSDRSERYWSLTRFLQITGGIRSRVRLFGELRCLSARQTAYLCRLIDKVQKQAHGWRNTLSRATEPRQGGSDVAQCDKMELPLTHEQRI